MEDAGLFSFWRTLIKIFKSFKDIGDSGTPISTQLVAAKLLCGLIEACIDGNGRYEPEDDGRVVLIEETDTEEMIEDLLGRRLEDALFEPGFMERGFFISHDALLATVDAAADATGMIGDRHR